MIKYIGSVFFVCSIVFVGCGVIRDTPKYSFSNGYYFSKVFEKPSPKVYVENTCDSIYVYPVAGRKNSSLSDTLITKKISFPQKVSGISITSNNFRQTSFDIDFLTIPFKYRPGSNKLPGQFNTNLNGAVYIGFRNDIYRLWYKKTPLNSYTRQTTHYGFSLGFFNGFGGTAMNPWVTENQISSEYDGVVWSKGFAGILGIDHFTIGLALGWDNLLDKNKKYWIYQGKPWLGLAFGLNLN